MPAHPASSNRLQTVAGPVMKTYTYDAAGNPLSDGATTFTWNAAGKLANTVNNAKTHFYRYNALDQRITKNGPLSSKFMFFYDSDGQLIGEYRDNASTATPTDDWLVRQETIWLEDIPVAVIRKPTATSPIQVYYIHADHLNTPRVIVNTANTIVWRWENTHPFGASLPDEDPDGNAQLFEYHPRFPGQYFDKETNLHYNYFRYYEPETGRYVSPDPIGLAGGLNTYGYVEQNPLSFIDPYGLFELPVLSQDFVDATAGFGDAISSGFGLFDTSLSELVRKAINVNSSVNQCSAAYSSGRYAGYGLSFGLGAYGLARGGMALGPGGRLIGHPAYGGRTIDGLRNGEIRFGWSRNNGPNLRLGIRNRYIDIVKLRPPKQ